MRGSGVAKNLHVPPCMPRRCTRGDGFSLVEVLVATSVFVVALAATAPLVTTAIHANARARAATFSMLLAEEKMEELVAALWQQDTPGIALVVSPPGTLKRSTAGYCDYVDRYGHGLGGGPEPPPGAAYLRRWSIDPLPMYPASTRVLQVVATPSRGGSDAAGDVTKLRDTARVVMVRTRRSS
jgi:prepilin-type N-terminal cleavage/methylation domain-containing protein